VDKLRGKKQIYTNSTHCEAVLSFFSPIFSCCAKSGNQPQEDLAKSGYKIDEEVENLGILFHVDDPLEPISFTTRTY
jgi:hypothetical protein